MKDYKQMTAEEQLQWLNRFGEFVNLTMPGLKKSEGRWTLNDMKYMKSFMQLLTAWPFSRDFAEQALRYNDYAGRFYRFETYINLVKEQLAEGLSVTDSNGERFVIVDPSVPMRRRGRPTKEEVQARLRGDFVLPADPSMEQQRKIASLLGLNVVISNNHPREKNNTELAEERARKQAEYERQNPSLFKEQGAGDNEQEETGGDAARTAAGVEQPAHIVSNPGGYISPMEYHLTLAQKAPFMRPELQEQVAQIRNLRTMAGAAAEKAKTMTELKRPAKDIEECAKESARLYEQYETTLAAIDDELASVFYRLQNDGPYRQRFVERFRFKDTESINEDLMHDLRKHYKKVCERQSDFNDRMARIVEQESPEYVAKVKAEQERRDEVAAIIKYLRRGDKPNTLVRITTMKERYQRLSELIGAEEAKAYYVFVNKAEDDYNEHFRAADEAEAKKKAEEEATKKAAKKAKAKATKKPAKKTTKK